MWRKKINDCPFYNYSSPCQFFCLISWYSIHLIYKSHWYCYPLLHKSSFRASRHNPSSTPALLRKALSNGSRGNDPPPASVRKQEKNGLIDFPSAILGKEENKWHSEAVRKGKIESGIFGISQPPIFLGGTNKRNWLKRLNHMETLLNNSQAGQAEYFPNQGTSHSPTTTS